MTSVFLILRNQPPLLNFPCRFSPCLGIHSWKRFSQCLYTEGDYRTFDVIVWPEVRGEHLSEGCSASPQCGIIRRIDDKLRCDRKNRTHPFRRGTPRINNFSFRDNWSSTFRRCPVPSACKLCQSDKLNRS